MHRAERIRAAVVAVVGFVAWILALVLAGNAYSWGAQGR
jgi:hypothetical protein